MRRRKRLCIWVISQFLDLFEMPVGTLSTIGDFTKAHSFKHQNDRKLLTNPAYIERIKTAFSRTHSTFDLYFVNKPGLASSWYLEKGVIPQSFIFAKHNPKERDPGCNKGLGLGLDPNTFKLDPDAITIFFTNNSGAERMPMTAWIIAHRVGHAMRLMPGYQAMTKYTEKAFDQLAGFYGISHASPSYGFGSDDYSAVRKREQSMKYLAQSVCTMRSARDQNMRNFYEMNHELFAQYLLDGRIVFNKAPDYIPVSFTWGRPNMRRCSDKIYAQQILDSLSANYEQYADAVLEEATGQCFLM